VIRVVNAYVQDRDVVVWYLAEDGTIQHRKDRAEYSFFVRSGDIPEDLRRRLRGASLVRGMREEPGGWTRITWADQWARRDMIYGRKRRDADSSIIHGSKIPSPFQELGIEIFEGDVDPVRRWFTDTPDAVIAKPERGFFDLETDSRVTVKLAREGRARILSIALTDESEERQWLGILDRDDDEAEKQLILEFFRKVDEFGMWQLLAWGGDTFDFTALGGRIERLGISIDLRKYLFLDHLVMFKRMNLNSSDSGDEKQSMALQAIAQAQLGEGKEVAPPEIAAKYPGRSMASISWELWRDHREVLGRYNMQDTVLMARLERKTGFAALFDTLCDVCKVLPDSRGLKPTRQMDGFMLRLGLERGHRFPTRYFSDEKDEEEHEQYEGAFVMEPKRTGILRGVHVADFASLYPSVIITWNMSPETKISDDEARGRAGGYATSPLTGICFDTSREGMLPLACRTMKGLRKEWSDKQAKLPPGTPEAKEAARRSMAYKVANNSFYGVVGSRFSRYFDEEVAESVTQNAVWLIKRTIAEAEKRGMDVFYGDTDSFFAMETSRTEFERFVRWSNSDLYPEMLREVGCATNVIELAYEKEFSLLAMMPVKKRYAGRFEHYKGSPGKPVPEEGEAFDKAKHSRPEIKGLEFKRGDASVLARRLQEKVVMALMREQFDPRYYRALLGEALEHVAKDYLPLEEIQVTKSINKDLADYHRKKANGEDITPPVHVQVAEYLQKQGKEIGDGARVSYVVVDASDKQKAIPSEEYVGEIDRYYVWESQTYPPSMRVLQAAFPNEDWSAGLERIRPRKSAGVLRGQRALFAEVVDPIASARDEHERHLAVAMNEARLRAMEAEVAWRARR
jgi:DNA polymerase I